MDEIRPIDTSERDRLIALIMQGVDQLLNARYPPDTQTFRLITRLNALASQRLDALASQLQTIASQLQRIDPPDYYRLESISHRLESSAAKLVKIIAAMNPPRKIAAKRGRKSAKKTKRRMGGR